MPPKLSNIVVEELDSEDEADKQRMTHEEEEEAREEDGLLNIIAIINEEKELILISLFDFIVSDICLSSTILNSKFHHAKLKKLPMQIKPKVKVCICNHFLLFHQPANNITPLKINAHATCRFSLCKTLTLGYIIISKFWWPF